jgi:hypothetical protein
LERGLHEALGTAIVSIFTYGALAFPHPDGWRADLDFHVLLERPLMQGDRAAIDAVHARLGTDVDGYYITVDDAWRFEPPRHQLDLSVRDDGWALHRAHVLAGRYFLIVGRDPQGFLPAPTWTEVEDGLRSELRFIETHREYADFGILNACRLLYTVERRDAVVSKYAAAQWARQRVPQSERAAIDAAVRAYTSHTRAGDEAVLATGWSALVARAKKALG